MFFPKDRSRRGLWQIVTVWLFLLITANAFLAFQLKWLPQGSPWSSSFLARQSLRPIKAAQAMTLTHENYLPLVAAAGATVPPAPPTSIDADIVFVSRQIPAQGTVYWDPPGSLPGVGPYSRFQIAAPGKLIVREAGGALQVLVDGSNPTATSLHLVDVNAPDVSYDGTKIVFAGLPAGTYDTKPMNNPGAWRIYTINVDGTGLQQVTFPDQDHLDFSDLSAPRHFKLYDDTDPVWLPDGRVVFASTRWPSFGQYGGARTSNLYVINTDGSGLHRITAERNGAERPLIDPVTGKIVYTRWWRNHRYASNSMETIALAEGGYEQHIGLTKVNTDSPGGKDNLQRNTWQLVTINPDGTNLVLWTGRSRPSTRDSQFGYGGAFSPDGVLYANYFPMQNGTEAAGFGGIRRYERGATFYSPILGITTNQGHQLASETPPSYGVFVGSYAAEPAVLPDGRLIVSWAPDVAQDYGLYLVDADGSNKNLLYDQPGTTEVRARVVAPRSLPPIIPDQVTAVASLLPPTADGPYDSDGTFTFHALNVYFNAPVDSEITSAPPVGSAATIRFYIDHQRSENAGSFPSKDWPILVAELPVNPDGSVINPNLPANVPLFEQLRSTQPEYQVPLTGRTEPLRGQFHQGGAAHVAGMNFGRTGAVERCVGCHAGHTLIPVPADPDAAQWTNLAPGAEIAVSSADPAISNQNFGLIDRRAQTGALTDYWRSDPGQEPAGQWVQLTFPVPVTVNTVRLYNPRHDNGGQSTVQVQSATVRLYRDSAATDEVATRVVGPLAEMGTDVSFDSVTARVVRVELTRVTGLFLGKPAASLAEIEVIARAEAGP